MPWPEIVYRIRERIDTTIDWPLLQKLRVSKAIIGMLVLDFMVSLTFMVPTAFANFLYINEAGRAGFIHKKWMNYTDIFHFRRFQPWEAKEKRPIDWTENDYAYINETRHILDATCSNYETDESIPGDPGDYLKEIVGHPNTSGYNSKLRSMIRTFSAALSLHFLSCPILVLALWWKKHALRFVVFYIVLSIIPMILLIAVCEMARDPKMCAINIIYSNHPVQTYFIIFTVLFWLYTLVKFVYLGLHTLEQSMRRKRKDFGFKKNIKHEESNKKKAGIGRKRKDGDHDVDMEALLKKQKRGPSTVLTSLDAISGQKLAREILELGTTTDEEFAEEKNRKSTDHKRNSRPK